MADTLKLVGGDGQIVDLYPWLNPINRNGLEALAGIEGFGLPPTTARWFNGAGEGSRYRGSRTERRPVILPLYVYAEDRAGLNDQVSNLARVLDYGKGESQLIIGTPDQNEWMLRVVRVGGGDWKRKTDSDDRTYFKTTIQLEAGAPFWQRITPEQFDVKIDTSSPKLLPYLARLQLGSGTAFGERTVTNPGDAPAWPFWTIQGPTTQVQAIGANGETVVWDDTLSSGETLYMDFRNSLVYDQRGPVAGNRYDGLAPAPRFWSIAPGTSVVTVAARDASEGQQDGDTVTGRTSINAQWAPRRWAVV